MQTNTTAGNNVAVGHLALNANTTGANNTAVGVGALDHVTTGNGNTAIGYYPANALTEGDHNVILGRNPMNGLTTGDNNIGLGADAGNGGSPGGAVTTASNRVCIGDDAITNAHIQVDWTIASDKRDKTDVSPMDLGLEFINQLNQLLIVGINVANIIRIKALYQMEHTKKNNWKVAS